LPARSQISQPKDRPAVHAAKPGRLLPLLLLLMLSTAVQAQFNYSVANGKVTIMGYSGPGGVVTIPPTIEGLPVTSIGEGRSMAAAA